VDNPYRVVAGHRAAVHIEVVVGYKVVADIETVVVGKAVVDTEMVVDHIELEAGDMFHSQFAQGRQPSTSHHSYYRSEIQYDSQIHNHCSGSGQQLQEQMPALLVQFVRSLCKTHCQRGSGNGKPSTDA